MSALVGGEGWPRRWWARCIDCNWESEPNPSNIPAYVDARAHNLAHHDFESFELEVPA